MSGGQVIAWLALCALAFALGLAIGVIFAAPESAQGEGDARAAMLAETEAPTPDDPALWPDSPLPDSQLANEGTCT